MIKNVRHIHPSLITVILMTVFFHPTRMAAQQHVYPESSLFLTRKASSEQIKTDNLFPLSSFQVPSSPIIDSIAIFRKSSRLSSLFLKRFLTFSTQDTLLSTPHQLRIDFYPIIHAQSRGLKDSISSLYRTNSRGLGLKLSIDSNFVFESMFVENQVYLPPNLFYQAQKDSVVPGQGRFKLFKQNGYDYGYASGVMAFKGNSHVDLQLGHGKLKRGDGYRSLFIGDHIFNYPYLRVNLNMFQGRLRYAWVINSFIHLSKGTIVAGTEELFSKRAGNFHFIDFQIHPKIQIHFSQGILSRHSDQFNQLELHPLFFSPLPGISPMVLGQSNSYYHHYYEGGVKLHPYTSGIIYGALMLSPSPSPEKLLNFQVGHTYQKHFSKSAIFVQTEANIYTGKSNSFFTHYQQAIAYSPRFNEGKEAVLLFLYRYKRWLAFQKIVFQQEKNKTALANQWFDGNLGFVLNEHYKLNMSLGYQWAVNKSLPGTKPNIETRFVYLSLRTSLFNLYTDL